MKRGLAVLAILLLVVASAACGNDDNEDRTPTVGTGGAVTTSTSSSGGAATTASTETGGSATEATGGEATSGTGGAAMTGDAAKGKELASSLGCTGCHTVDGSKLVGPTWKGAYGEEVKLASGETVTVDDAYIHESIVDPSAKVVDGYQPIMPSFKGQVDDQQIADITAYIKSLK